ncbi:TetR family transcriptional regulator [Streptomyces sp. N2-109]|uniref:TetR family transcriptional regulator n=1 Tax=Streptomyces gossypii TaxID=2883101 RepID=A0ABT2JNR3_9ACTN|nr:TetR family transcriptional regulator [Streptomyces gossypii]MCT2589522.1 TetR family transcriptional regulator [Streptomyces gossypii]
MSEPHTDGRRLKGERRRQELIEATLRVVAREGVTGVSHRAVSREAGLSPTAAAYHFDSIDDLLTAALTSCMDESARVMREFTAVFDSGTDALPALAEQFARLFVDPTRLLAEFELFLLAAREPELRAPTHRWLEAVAEFARRHTSDPVRVRTVVAAVDGMLMHGLLREQPPTAEQFEAVLRALLTEAAPGAAEPVT